MNEKADSAAHSLFLANDVADEIAVRLVRERDMRAAGYVEEARDARAAIRCLHDDHVYYALEAVVYALEAIRA